MVQEKEDRAVTVWDREPEKSPAEVVENATTQAKLLMNIVDQTGCYQEIAGKKYLQVEAWETIGAFNSAHAETAAITPIFRENEIIGYQAHVQLWKGGKVVGGAVMPCYFSENCCKGKEGDAKHKASMSAAQTFATSKAYRMNYSYVAILAGYQPTPAEEMMEYTGETKTEHWCQVHNCQFHEMKKGKSKWWAHKIEGTDDWCNEDKVQKSEKQRAEKVGAADNGESQAPETVVTTDLRNLEIRNLGDLFNAAYNHFGLNQTETLKELGGISKSDIADPKAEWLKIVSMREG